VVIAVLKSKSKKKIVNSTRFLKTLNSTNNFQMKRFGLLTLLSLWVAASFAQMAPADFGSKFLEANKLI